MDDILASIRRILDDDQAVKAPGADVLMLDTSMMVEADTALPHTAALPEMASRAEPPPVGVIAPEAARVPEIDPVNEVATVPVPEPVQIELVAPSPGVVPEKTKNMASSDDELTVGSNVPREAAPSLVAPAAAAAAANSVGALMRTLAAERGTGVSRTGATIEDLVRGGNEAIPEGVARHTFAADRRTPGAGRDRAPGYPTGGIALLRPMLLRAGGWELNVRPC